MTLIEVLTIAFGADEVEEFLAACIAAKVTPEATVAASLKECARHHRLKDYFPV